MRSSRTRLSQFQAACIYRLHLQGKRVPDQQTVVYMSSNTCKFVVWHLLHSSGKSSSVAALQSALWGFNKKFLNLDRLLPWPELSLSRKLHVRHPVILRLTNSYVRVVFARLSRSQYLQTVLLRWSVKNEQFMARLSNTTSHFKGGRTNIWTPMQMALRSGSCGGATNPSRQFNPFHC